MSRRLNRLGLLLVPFIASEVWALGLGDIRLDSALNEPLDAEIALLSVTPEELESLRVGLASAETFGRYGIDRPVFLTRIDFDVVRRGSGYVIDVTSEQPVTEPFVTFLVEANWSRGRLLREYTVLLDPPTFAPPPATQETQAVDAPRQAAPADRGRIERPAARQPDRPAADDAPAGAFDTAAGGDYRVARGDTLWRIAEELRPDERLSMNQVMLAIYEANPQAFDGNINRLRANASLSIPSADDIYRIARGDALAEIRRQNEAWTGAPQPTLTLVAPDERQTDYTGAAGQDEAAADRPLAAGAEQRIRQLEQTITEQESLLEIRDNELAELRQELQRLREERAAAATAEPAEPVADEMPAEEPAVEADEIFVEDEPATAAGEPAAEDAADTATEAEPTPAPVAPTRREAPEPGLVDRILGVLTGFWGIVGAALLVVLALLAWFARRASSRGEDAETTGVWEALDADEEADRESAASTERLRAMARDEDESIVVVEQDSGDTLGGDTVETPRAAEFDDEDESGQSGIRQAPEPASFEDTFSSETAINLDQSDPIAEADFHMAYGLYDQAADLVNGALAVEPDRGDLLAKLCEIYFVWGNRDAFVEAAGRLKTAAGESGDWDKIVIMGQQIAPDHELFAGAQAGGAATQAVDLDFEGGSESSSALDLDFAGDESDDDVIDLGGDEEEAGGTTTAVSDDGLDFSFGDEEEDTGASATREMPGRGGDDDPTVETPTWSGEAIDDDETQESPTFSGQGFDEDPTQESPTLSREAIDDDATQESRTVEMPRDRSDETSELRAFDSDERGRNDESRSGDATAEIDLDDLGLDLDGLGGDLDSDDTALLDADETGTDFDELAETGRNRELDEDATSRTGRNEKPDDDLLDATGQTQVLPDDFTVETGQHEKPLSDDDATMMAPGLDSDDEDFDFAKTEALPKESFDSEDTAERPAGSTDMDLDLDDLTAALKYSEGGDTVEQRRDDETVEQPRPGASRDDDLDFDLGLGEDATQEMTPEDVSDELAEARTMTEVGTKLDLARAYVDMGDPGGARNILEEVLEEGDESQRQQAQQLLDSLPG